MSGFEISNSKSVAEREDEGTVVHIADAVGEKMFYGEGDEKKPVTITVAGTYSATYRRATDAQRERMMKQRRAALTGEQLAKQQLALVASCVLAWGGFVNNDKPFPATKENAMLLFDQAPWIREQVEEAMNDHQAFFPSSSGA